MPRRAFPAAGDRGARLQRRDARQKAFNGVAILSKRPFEVARGLPGDEDDSRRAISRRWFRPETASCGSPASICRTAIRVDTEKYPYKLGFMERLIATRASCSPMRSRWCWRATTTSSPRRATPPARGLAQRRAVPAGDAREFRALLALGLTDALRATTDAAGLYTFWDYQAGAWQRNNGIRIDHLLLSPQAADRLQRSTIDKEMRGRDKPSDHTPIRIELAL